MVNKLVEPRDLHQHLKNFNSSPRKQPVQPRLFDETSGDCSGDSSAPGAAGAAASNTRMEALFIQGDEYPLFINEFWTSRQRQAANLHEVAYRACFKPQLPRFFIQLLTSPGEVVYDPFMGRGTTPVEAALLDRIPAGVDVNPLSCIFTQPRLEIPPSEEIHKRLERLNLQPGLRAEMDLSMFYHPHTQGELVSLREYLQERWEAGTEDSLDRWIRMVATNRLTGHSTGFFSVYTLPPNQAVTPARQRLINQKYQQEPAYRDVKHLIWKKTRQLLSDLSPEHQSLINSRGEESFLAVADSRSTSHISGESVQLTVTSPPFLDIVQYAKDNWLRCWFNGIDAKAVEEKMVIASKIEEWSAVMEDTFRELFRLTRPGGWVAFEVGEVRRGKVKLEEQVIPAGERAGFTCHGVLINQQNFTKTANIWGVNNNRAGTNSNRVVLFQK